MAQAMLEVLHPLYGSAGRSDGVGIEGRRGRWGTPSMALYIYEGRRGRLRTPTMAIHAYSIESRLIRRGIKGNPTQDGWMGGVLFPLIAGPRRSLSLKLSDTRV